CALLAAAAAPIACARDAGRDAPPAEEPAAVARASASPAAPAAFAPGGAPELGTDAPVIVPVANANVITYQPAVAFGQSSYLAVWMDDRADDISGSISTSGRDIYGARIAPDGTLLETTAFPIVVAPGQQTNPWVIFDGTNWLVFWSDDRNPDNLGNTFVARVAPDGTVLDPLGVPLFPAPSPYRTSAITGLDFDGAHVVATLATASGVFATLIQADGTAGAPFKVAPGTVIGGGTVAYDGSSHLVTYATTGSGSSPITTLSAQRFTSAGALVGPAISLGTGSASTFSGAQVASAGNGGWLVTFGLAGPRYALVDPSGNLAAGAVPGAANPGVADYFGGAYTLFYAGTMSIQGARLGSGTITPTTLVSSNVTAGPSVAHDATGQLMVFVQGREVVASHVTTSLTLTDSPPILVSRRANPQTWPSVSWNGTEYMLVWQDGREI